MQSTAPEEIREIVARQKSYFRTGATLDIEFRKRMLKRLQQALQAWEGRLTDALWQDLHKCREEAYLTELGILNGEIKVHLKNIGKWASKEKVKSSMAVFPSRSYITKEPLGTALIISPWNYPVQLLLNPLIGAISAGCTAVLKPSPYVPAVSETIEKMIAETFNREYVAVVQGHRDVNQELLQQRWDMIFFTGSPALGKTVMEAASRNLTPVVLELGGKSPCIIDRTADIPLAAKRIAWGKTLNSGQTCIAPDYLILHSQIKDEFIRAFAKEIKGLHGDDIFSSPHYVHMVNSKAFYRVSSYLSQGKILYGGRTDEEKLCIEPTILECTHTDIPAMQEEIFGPVFPTIIIDDENFIFKATSFIVEREKPLALYFFGKENDGWEIILQTSSGGGCINDVIMHIANGNMPFGGVGNSGMGRYHHHHSFECFTHTRSILVTPNWPDMPFRYMPYKFFKWVKRIM